MQDRRAALHKLAARKEQVARSSAAKTTQSIDVEAQTEETNAEYWPKEREVVAMSATQLARSSRVEECEGRREAQ